MRRMVVELEVMVKDGVVYVVGSEQVFEGSSPARWVGVDVVNLYRRYLNVFVSLIGGPNESAD